MRIDKLFSLVLRMGDGSRIQVTAYDSGETDWKTGHHYVNVEVKHFAPGRTVAYIFHANPLSSVGVEMTIGIPGHHSIYGVDAKRAVLGWLSVKPGDTDDDFFAKRSPVQLDFVTTYGEEMAMISEERYGL